MLDASKEVGLEVNAEKTICMFMSDQTVGQNHYIKVLVGNKSFENVVKVQIFGKC